MTKEGNVDRNIHNGYRSYVDARRIAEVIISYFNTDITNIREQPSRQDFRRYPPDFQGKTQQGFFLEFSYNTPTFVHTPWGRWGVLGGGLGNLSEANTEQLLAELGAELYSEQRQTKSGPIGPIYKIRSVHGETLPEPIEAVRTSYQVDRQADIQARQAWIAMTKRYEHTQLRSQFFRRRRPRVAP